jgi:hypothetical protein
MLEWTDGQVAWQTISPEGVLPQKEHTPIVDGKLKIDIPLSKDFVSTYQAMEKVRADWTGLMSADSVYQLVDKGLVKCIGVSNFNIYRLKQLLAAAKYPPVASERNPLKLFLVADIRFRSSGALNPESSIRVCDLDEGTWNTTSSILAPWRHGRPTSTTAPHSARDRAETRRSRCCCIGQLAVEARDPASTKECL